MSEIVALYGDPVAGNPTSVMQNAAFRAAGLDFVYVDIRVAAPELPEALLAARTLRFAGLNCTIPHKVAVIPLLDALEPSAELIGAVNTIRREGTRLVGANTDGVGFLSALRDAGVDPAGTRAVLLGAGGAARAVASELARAGAAAIAVAGRDAARRRALVEHLRARTAVAVEELTWDGELTPPRCDLLVNCTPVGMGTGAAADAVPAVRLDALAGDAIVCDLNPDVESSAFVRAARARGLTALGGLPMLARQGAAAFEAWTGRPASLPVMVAALEAAVGGPGAPAEMR